MSYQDKLFRGAVAERGYRDCAGRYEIVKTFCTEHFAGRPFTVCDIGSNWSYFGLRLTTDFPLCSVVAFEFNGVEARREHLRKNRATRILLCGAKLNIPELRILAGCCHFDLVLALSVFHHMVGTLKDKIAAVGSIGDEILIELAGQDSPRVKSLGESAIPEGATVLGFGISHKQADARRPIIHIAGTPRR